eukprot:308381-Prymnesium_polylepis.1
MTRQRRDAPFGDVKAVRPPWAAKPHAIQSGGESGRRPRLVINQQRLKASVFGYHRSHLAIMLQGRK